MKATHENSNQTYRKTAVLVGVLYILGTVTGVLSVIFTQPVTNATEYLTAILANQNQVTLGALFILAMGLSLAWVAILLFPVLKKFNEALAIGYVVFRGTLETVTYLAMVVCMLLLPSFAKAYAGAPGASNFQSLAESLLQVHATANLMLIIVFCLGALILYSALYASKLIPRWLSVWGILAILLHLSTAFLDMFGLMDASVSGTTFILNFPIFSQEMVMAVWLIAKGFNPSAIVTEQA
ncbi:MAG: DUF4386 domain-containing protein [Chloroflexota bacterium]